MTSLPCTSIFTCSNCLLRDSFFSIIPLLNPFVMTPNTLPASPSWTSAMATRCLAFLAGIMIFGQTASGWEVTPNSPCASSCIDSIDLDISDANSSTTTNTDITCRDGAHLSTSKGQKFKSCMECLQESTFSQGSENDQMWFLCMLRRTMLWLQHFGLIFCPDNLRYSFNYCVYAYPNATGVNVGPCATSAACNVLKPGLISDELDPDKVTPYGYCDSEITGEYFDRCLDCVRGDHTMNSLANCREAKLPYCST